MCLVCRTAIIPERTESHHVLQLDVGTAPVKRKRCDPFIGWVLYFFWHGKVALAFLMLQTLYGELNGSSRYNSRHGILIFVLKFDNGADTTQHRSPGLVLIQKLCDNHRHRTIMIIDSG
jgi:hypothetical protein